jgi:hypothetical protein
MAAADCFRVFMTKNTPEKINARVKELFGYIGEALWCIQGLEELLAKYYVVFCTCTGDEKAEDIDAQFEGHFCHTLGQMVRIFKADSNPDAAISQRLDDFANERNSLVHRLQRQDYHKLMEGDKFPQLVLRVKSLVQEAEAIIELFNSMMIDHFVALGCERDFITQAMEQEHRIIMKT